MHAWIDQALANISRGEPTVLVTVARVQGSTPREAGARMLVSASQQWFTVGGGHLEWVATDVARKRLHAPLLPARWVERLPLGPSLGQCCGGMVHLLFERLDAGDLPWLRSLGERLEAGAAVLRQVEIAVPEAPLPSAGAGAEAGGEVATALRPAVHLREIALDAGPVPEGLLATLPGAPPLFAEVIANEPLRVFLFGAGHVGKALVHVLAPLPCRIVWVDEREGLFPRSPPPNVRIEATDTPEAVIDEAPAQSCFLIMTHDHGLDQRLCEQLLRRDDFLYFGLIGSLTKRRKFERRLQARGVPPARLARMVCPIGEPGITGKQPAVIAVAVAAQLLRVHAESQTRTS